MTDIIETNSAEDILHCFGPDPNPPDKEDDWPQTFWEEACEGMLESEQEWRQHHQIFAWVDEKPDWVSFMHWEITGALADPDKPCTRIFRLELLGGGQIKVVEQFEVVKVETIEPFLSCAGRQTLQVQAKTAEGLRTVRGVIDGGPFCEMSAYAVAFGAQVPQAIADRVAATFRLINSRDDFIALLAHSNRCCCCGRPLKDEVSKLLSIGPSCAKAMRLPHDISTANRVLARRRELLGDNH